MLSVSLVIFVCYYDRTENYIIMVKLLYLLIIYVIEKKKYFLK